MTTTPDPTPEHEMQLAEQLANLYMWQARGASEVMLDALAELLVETYCEKAFRSTFRADGGPRSFA